MGGIKKHRGLRRYYKNLKVKSDSWSGLNSIDPKMAWFDLWHTHFDWMGYGNDNFKSRKPHLDKLFRHFDLLNDTASSLKTNYQIWATLLDYNSHSDALFLHTPNPNHNNFPWRLPNLSQVSTLTNNSLIQYIENLNGYEKLYGEGNEPFCLLFKKNIGVAFQ